MAITKNLSFFNFLGGSHPRSPRNLYRPCCFFVSEGKIQDLATFLVDNTKCQTSSRNVLLKDQTGYHKIMSTTGLVVQTPISASSGVTSWVSLRGDHQALSIQALVYKYLHPIFYVCFLLPVFVFGFHIQVYTTISFVEK